MPLTFFIRKLPVKPVRWNWQLINDKGALVAMGFHLGYSTKDACLDSVRAVQAGAMVAPWDVETDTPHHIEEKKPLASAAKRKK